VPEVRLDGHAVPVRDATRVRSGGSLRSVARATAISSARRAVHLTSRLPHRYAGAWLLMDSRAANDDAEHLFRHLRRHRPNVNAWFVLAPDTPEWDRLAADGFGDRLLARGSRSWKLALLACTHVISSRLDVGAIAPPAITRWRQRPLHHTHLALQGGPPADESALLTAPMDLLVVSSRDDLEAIVGDGSPSMFTHKEVTLPAFRDDRWCDSVTAAIEASAARSRLAPRATRGGR